MAATYRSCVLHSITTLLLCWFVATEQVVLRPDDSSRAGEIKHKLIRAEIIPTVLDLGFVPSHDLSVKWAPKSLASLGNTLKPRHLEEAPDVLFAELDGELSSCQAGVTYIIAATDPDAPSRDNPEWSEFCHWIAQGVAVSLDSTCATLQLKELEEIITYKPPTPPAKTGKHRYVFIGLRPANGTTERLQLSKPGTRKHWGTGKERHGFRDWAFQNGLQPIAANFFYAQNKKQ